jgi:hypothetical protein
VSNLIAAGKQLPTVIARTTVSGIDHELLVSNDHVLYAVEVAAHRVVAREAGASPEFVNVSITAGSDFGVKCFVIEAGIALPSSEKAVELQRRFSHSSSLSTSLLNAVRRIVGIDSFADVNEISITSVDISLRLLVGAVPIDTSVSGKEAADYSRSSRTGMAIAQLAIIVALIST